ncbi:PAS domain-containing sensor histidine kinase [Calothrix sp. 336/3]|uniref:PAS domain-containing sensor histidine kinase n=1 Tax=Calothrix sp. 336/3 TaxID=1337936 RepID=UPI00069BD7A7|nr:ATP-binding protein [Calothrix sp. 336/3]
MNSKLQDIVFQFSSDLYCLIGDDGYFQQVNTAWEDLLGWTEAELILQPWFALVHPEELNITMQVYQELVSGEAIQLENRYSHKDGTYRWLAWRMLLNDDGQVYGIGRDISTYKQQELALEAIVQRQATNLRMARQAEKLAREQFQEAQQQLNSLKTQFEERLRLQVEQRVQQILLGESIPADISYTLTYEDLLRSMLDHLYPAIPHDISGTILLLDTQPEGLESTLENRRYNLPGCKLFFNNHRPLSNQLQEDIQQQMLVRLSKLSGQDLSQASLTVHYLNSLEPQAENTLDDIGSLLLVPLINTPYEDNRIIGLLFVGTEQVEQFNEEQIRLLYHVASNASIAIQQLRFFFITLEKYDLESILAHLPEGVLLLDAEQRVILTNPVARDYLSSLADINGDNVLQTLGGKSLQELQQCDIHDPSCNEVTSVNQSDLVIEVIVERVTLEIHSVYWLVLLRDISDRKRVEAEIRKALEKERELNSLKSRLVRTISHEYRTPLATIILAAETLTKYYDRLAKDKQFSALKRIQTAAQQMAQLVDDILLSNQIESGKLAFHPAPLDIVKFCEQIVEDIKLLGDYRHRIIFTHKGDMQSIHLDATLVRQFLTNLLNNAIKYSPEGGIVRLRLASGNGKVVFQVEDQGITIPPLDQPKIFDAFHRGSNVDTIPGTGLGLAIVKKAVELHGGEIRFHSQLGVGTTFTVKLPLVSSQN